MSDPGQEDTRQRRLIFGGTAARPPASRLGVAVVRDLVSAIVTGEVEPGATLPPEGLLSQHFGVSRTVIRESVKRIEEKGLVTIEQGRGTQVLEPGSWNVLDPVILSVMVENDDILGVLEDLAVVRGALEASMASQSAQLRSDEELDDLKADLDRMKTSMEDTDAFNAADAAFHIAVMHSSRNRLAESITKILFQRARDSSRFRGNSRPGELELTLAEHTHIYDAIAAKDSEGAAEAMRKHIHDAWGRRRPEGEARS